MLFYDLNDFTVEIRSNSISRSILEETSVTGSNDRWYKQFATVSELYMYSKMNGLTNEVKDLVLNTRRETKGVVDWIVSPVSALPYIWGVCLGVESTFDSWKCIFNQGIHESACWGYLNYDTNFWISHEVCQPRETLRLHSMCPYLLFVSNSERPYSGLI